ncbi:hypothetical protein TeGR_g1561 [Tetraparma gracilis]|uniref:Thioredoxin domain-containing protein n=1 Tax=Tetraparma gracilis TaxID=2962635 RepID=A0ABQ6MTY7_9STRA|nr:hypothetical protein TeGR_g1561 [Tetraparma gracilis]
MSCLCIGGVCIPYSALIPALMMALKWVLDKLRSVGLLSKASPSAAASSSGSCCGAKEKTGGSCCGASGEAPKPVSREERRSQEANFLPIESMEEWADLVKTSAKTGAPIIVDFTASWCKPCKAIAPFFESLAGRFDGTFVKVDVDELDELAERAKVSMMPTFAVYKGEEQVEKLAGANENKLSELVARHAAEFK